jgi:hypothetical protein
MEPGMLIYEDALTIAEIHQFENYKQQYYASGIVPAKARHFLKGIAKKLSDVRPENDKAPLQGVRYRITRDARGVPQKILLK